MSGPAATSQAPRVRRIRLAVVGLVVAVAAVVGAVAVFVAVLGRHHHADACARATARSPAAGETPLHCWLAHPIFYIAHRGGDAAWVEGTADAYRHAVGWNRALALEVPVWRTADGVWVISEDPTTERVFGVDDVIAQSTWAQLSALRTRHGDHPMARLVEDVLMPYGDSRILFVDDKGSVYIDEFLDLLDSYAGASRYVVKCNFRSAAMAAAAHRHGYVTWGYYFTRDMAAFASTESRFDLLGLSYSAPAADFAAMRATGKPVIAHVVRARSTAERALRDGVQGLMVSGVPAVVPRTG